MYSNRIVLMYFLVIVVCFSVNVSSKVINSKRHGVCSTVLKPRNLSPKVDLPFLKEGNYDGNLIRLNNCSISNEIKDKLKESGIDQYIKTTDFKKMEKNQLKEVEKEIVEFIMDVVNSVYRDNYYFDSYAGGYQFLDTGVLVINCVENSIPEKNFRLFVKDEESSVELDINPNNIVCSMNTVPSGKYRQINNERLVEKFFVGDKKIKKIDLKRIISLAQLRIYKNLSFVVHRNNGRVYFDLFFDKYNPSHEFRWDVNLGSKSPSVNVSFNNLDFMKNGSMFTVMAKIEPFSFLSDRQKLIFGFDSDVISSAFIKNGAKNVDVSSVYLTLSKNDVCVLFKRLLKELYNLRNQKVIANKLDSLSSKLYSEDSKEDAGIPGVARAVKENITNNLKKLSLKDFNLKWFDFKGFSFKNFDLKKFTHSLGLGEEDDDDDDDLYSNNNNYYYYSKNNYNKSNEDQLRDLTLRYYFNKRLENLEYKFISTFGVEGVSFINEVLYNFEDRWPSMSLGLLAQFSTSLEYKDMDITNNTFSDFLKDLPQKYRNTLSSSFNFKSGNKLRIGYCLTNNRLTKDFRSLKDTNFPKEFILGSHEFLFPLTFKYKIVPFLGIFCDLMVPFRFNCPGRCDISLGLMLSAMNINVSIPLLTKSNSKYSFNDFSKKIRKFYFT